MNGAFSNTLMKQGAESITRPYVPGSYTIDIKWDSAVNSSLTLKFVDKNGNAFNPKRGEILKRPNGATWLQTFDTYTIKPELFDDRMEFYIAQLPFRCKAQATASTYTIALRRMPSLMIIRPATGTTPTRASFSACTNGVITPLQSR